MLFIEVELELPFGVPLALSELVSSEHYYSASYNLIDVRCAIRPHQPVGLAIPVPTAPLTAEGRVRCRHGEVCNTLQRKHH